MAATTGLVGMFDRIRSALADDSRTDAELVREYAGTRSDDAFAELTRRYASMVWGVCRRTVGHHQSAEDVFQAVFLVLARKVSSIQPPSAVGGWLHGVAVHTSLRARAMTDRRRNRVKPLDADHESPAPHAEPTDPDVIRVLDAEIARLPEKLRTAVAMCELDGLSRRDAAKRLNIAEGTLSSRLAAGRKALAARLRSRGVALGVGGIAALVGIGTAGAVPPVVATASETVSALAEGVIRTMFLSKLKLMSVAAMAVILVAAFGAVVMTPASGSDRPQVRRNAPTPKVVGKDGVIALGIKDKDGTRIDLLTPTGEKVTSVPMGEIPAHYLSLSRDGKRVAAWSHNGAVQGRPNQKPSNNGMLRVFDVENPETPVATITDIHSGMFVFDPDGKSLFVNELKENDPAKDFQECTVFRFDLKTLKKQTIDLPPDLVVADLSPDGKTLLANSFKPKVKGKHFSTPYRVPLDTLKPEPLSKASFRAVKFSPDGGRILGYKFVDPDDAWKQELTIVDVKDGKESAVKLGEDTQNMWWATWAPDGKKLLVHRRVVSKVQKPQGPAPIPAGGGGPAIPLPDTDAEVAIRNLDGSDPKPLKLGEGVNLFGLDWR